LETLIASHNENLKQGEGVESGADPVEGNISAVDKNNKSGKKQKSAMRNKNTENPGSEAKYPTKVKFGPGNGHLTENWMRFDDTTVETDFSYHR
jgi:hypothetical protein